MKDQILNFCIQCGNEDFETVYIQGAKGAHKANICTKCGGTQHFSCKSSDLKEMKEQFKFKDPSVVKKNNETIETDIIRKRNRYDSIFYVALGALFIIASFIGEEFIFGLLIFGMIPVVFGIVIFLKNIKS